MVAPNFKSNTSSSSSQRTDVETTGKLMLTHNSQPITILLVDDDPDCRMLIRDAISECKVSNCIHEASDGREALAFLRRQGSHAGAPRTGLIYLDIEMPEMNGQ